jgi:hypothetical protein
MANDDSWLWFAQRRARIHNLHLCDSEGGSFPSYENGVLEWNVTGTKASAEVRPLGCKDPAAVSIRDTLTYHISGCVNSTSR